MKCSILSLTILFFILNSPFLVHGKGGSSGGRGSSGARSSSSSSSSSFSSGSRGSSSSYSSSSGSRPTYTTGTSNYRSSTNTQYNSNFRSGMFHSSTTSTYFVSSPMLHTHVIISPYTPMVYGGYNYYWGGHYVQSHERPLQCEYEITDSDEELRNVTFSNGTSPKTISFGCRGSEKCCGMECCSESTSVWVIIAVIAGIVALIFLCCYCQKKGYCQQEPGLVVGVPVITATTTTTSYCTGPTNGPFPGNDGPQFYVPPPGPPGYYPPPPQGHFNTYPPAPQGQFNQYPPPSAPFDNRPMSMSQVKTGIRY